ncbi:MAG: UvrD-helicase domain-containing protein, partial [Rectinemataceae bacterium]
MSVQLPPYLEKLDRLQRSAATADHNCVVTAGAGAGKTTVLASRYIHLVVGQGLSVRSILALTFTRKAAAEMYERIYAELASQNSPWAREQLDDFQNAHITTLDAFCADIVRQAARDFGYGREFSIDEEKSSDLVRGIAWRYVYRNRNKDGIREMLMSFTFDDVAARLFGDLGARHVTPLLLDETFFSPMKEPLEKMAAEKAGAALEQLAAMASDIIALSSGIAAPKADCAAALQASSAFLAADPRLENLSDLSEYQSHCIAFSSLGMRSYGKSDEEQAVKAVAADARQKAKTLLEFIDFKESFPSHCALLERLDEFAREAAEAKRLADLMDFKDLGACAVAVLKRRKDLRAFWKNGIESIMIDEFQDNNEQQKELLYLLAEKRESFSEGIPSRENLEDDKLFFVGDEKQSIYRFRGADVAVFKKLSNEFAGKIPGNFVLSSNYRSSSSLIGFFNAFFRSVMAEEAESSRAFSADYSPMEPAGGSASRTEGFQSSICYRLLEAQEEDEESDGLPGQDPGSRLLEADDSLAFEIAHFIRRSRGELELRQPGSEGIGSGTRKADWGDFAILLRTTTNQHRLEKYLRLLDIPFDSESPRGLFRESPANDLYAILSLVLDPGDKAAYAAVLRSPLCRVSDRAFLSLMTSSAENFDLAGAGDSGYDAMMLGRAKTFFAALRTKAGTSSVAETVDWAWHQGVLRLDLLSRPDAHPFLEHFDYLFHIAAEVDKKQGGLADFLSRLRPYIEGDSERFEIENVPRTRSSGVRLLTIHKSKGLQFPVVILPWVENKGSSRRGQTLWEMLPEGLAVDIKPYDKPGATSNNLFFKLGSELKREKDLAEIKRLLYVACTRAEDHLFFFGKRQKQADEKGLSFQYYLERYLASPDEVQSLGRIETRSLPRRTKDELRRWYGRLAEPSADDFAHAYANAKPLVRELRRRRLTVSELNSLANGESSAGVGAMTPLPLFQVAPPIPAEKFGDLCHDAVEKALENGLRGGYEPPATLSRGLDPDSFARAVIAATSMARGFLESEFWRSLPKAAEIKSEKSFIL